MSSGDTSFLSFDPSKSRFLLVGTSIYTADKGLPSLPAVANNLAKIESILLDKEIVGVSLDSIITVRNPRTKSEISDALVAAQREASDLLFIYYAGHGCLAQGTNKLYLATMTTTEADCAHNGFDFEEIRTALSKPLPAKRIIILDCCFSGNAIENSLSNSDPQAAVGAIVETAMDVRPQSVQPRSAYAIASAPANRLANDGEGKTYTAFTGELVELLEQGTGSVEDVLNMEQIYISLRQRIALNPKLPEPRRRIQHDGAAIVFARNRKDIPISVRLESISRLMADTVAAIEARLHRIEDVAQEIRTVAQLNEKVIGGRFDELEARLQDLEITTSDMDTVQPLQQRFINSDRPNFVLSLIEKILPSRIGVTIVFIDIVTIVGYAFTCSNLLELRHGPTVIFNSLPDSYLFRAAYIHGILVVTLFSARVLRILSLSKRGPLPDFIRAMFKALSPTNNTASALRGLYALSFNSLVVALLLIMSLGLPERVCLQIGGLIETSDLNNKITAPTPAR